MQTAPTVSLEEGLVDTPSDFQETCPLQHFL